MKRGGILAVPCAIGVGLLLAPPVAADTSSDLAQARQQQQLIDAVRSQLGNNLADALAAQDQLQKSLQENQKQQQAIQARIDAADARIAELDSQVRQLMGQIDETEQRIETERQQLRSLARALYVEPASVLVMLASAQDLSDLITRMTDLASAGTRARSLRLSLDRDLDRLDKQEAKVQAARAEQVTLRAQLGDSLAELQQLRAQQEESRRKLQAKIDQTRAEIGFLSSQSAQVAQQITDLLQQQQDAIIGAAMQQVWDQVKVWQQQNQVGPISTSPNHSQKYRFIWPEPGSQLVQAYGPTTLPFEPPYQGFAHFHTGIDTVLPLGAPVLAADDGIVVLVGGGEYGYGNYAVIEHQGGLTTLYGHLSRSLVKAGDQVTQGQPVGLEGSTGNSTGPHLHFELRIDGKPVDPLPYLPPGPPSDFRG